MTRTVYGPPLHLAVRGVGVGSVGVGLVTVALSVLVATEFPGWLTVSLGVVLTVVGLLALVVLLAGVLRAFGRGTRLVLDADGFVDATGFGPRAQRAAWRDVRKVQADGSIVSVDLAGGRQILIRTAVLDVEPRMLARELRSRLNRNRGYRSLSEYEASRPTGGQSQPAEG